MSEKTAYQIANSLASNDQALLREACTKRTEQDKLIKDIELLQLSIEHWERMRGYTGGERTNATALGIDLPYSGDCPLCKAYVLKHKPFSCAGCPITLTTGKEECVDTPYPGTKYTFKFGDNGEWQAAADAEIEFLHNLKIELEVKLR